MHAAFDVAARLDGVERRAGRELLRRGGGTATKGRRGGNAQTNFIEIPLNRCLPDTVQPSWRVNCTSKWR